MNTYIETDCTITHEGKAFTSGGAYASDDYLIAYPAANGVLTDWHGRPIGEWKTVATRRAVFFGYESWQGSTYYFMRARLTDGRAYALRGFGQGMIARGRRIKRY